MSAHSSTTLSSTQSSMDIDISDRPCTEAEIERISYGLTLLTQRLTKKYVTKVLHKLTLQYLCYDRQLDTTGTKSDLYDRLAEWTEAHVPPPAPRPPPSTQNQHVLGKQIMAAI
ncbi:hypothetical protein JAAARDRAFT_188480 [Jaapia argillacea MUCL 33604]|uniref:SAP domain-containing protein n=1 Tax=Jaapia argillacea MUCL 33604 TaxID=933084 RepID=A0A067QNU5_9AGAM|nr:hypothetical protein JAAARDRAFT_188480 [Jaapia argillacea MUCL 33604]